MRLRAHHLSLVSMRPLVVIPLLVCASLFADSAAPASASRVQARDSAQPASFPRSAVIAIAHGHEADAEKLAAEHGASDPAAAAILAQIDVRHGRYKEAQARLEPAAASQPQSDAALELAMVYRLTGRTADANTILDALAQGGAQSDTPDGLLRAARAEHALGRPRDANTLYRDAERAGANPAAVETAWGRLFLERNAKPDALKSFQAAIQADSAWAPAHAGLATLMADEDAAAAARSAQRALEIDPALAEAHLVLANLHLDDDRSDLAKAEIDKVLAINPSQLDALALQAAMAYVADDRAAFDRDAAAALVINPSFGELYRVAGEQAAAHYRFDEAVALTEKAVALDPGSSRAAADLGMHLLRTGNEPGARRTLARAFKTDPYDVVTYNLLALLDTLDNFVSVREGDFVIRMDPSEAPVLREYALPLAQQAIKTLSARYGFTPTGPILIEIFPKHDDFAVRNLGLPGMIGALGACFGRVVTMDSPHARPPGTFSWQATLWHELTHVITLQMSKQRIPRWLTEGISVYEEGRARPEWGREMEVAFAAAMNKGKVLKLGDLNAGFTQSDTIALAYYEASLLVDHIVETRGEDALHALVRAYGDGIDTDAAVQRTLHASLDDLQKTFDQALEQRFGAMRRALADPPPPEDATVDALREAAGAKPGSFMTQVALGQALAAKGDAAAYAPLERAAALVPDAIGEGSPHAMMAVLAERLGDKARAAREYDALLKADHTNIDAARKLWALADATGDSAQAASAIARVVALDPFDAAAHGRLGQAALKSGDADTASREFRAALAAGPADKAAAHCDLGESYLLAKRPEDAKKEALAALEIAPSYERAQELLLNAIGGARP